MLYYVLFLCGIIFVIIRSIHAEMDKFDAE